MQKAIDVLKVDIEGAEWPFLHEFVTTDLSRSVRQLIFEIHTPVFKPNKMTVSMFATVYNDLKLLSEKHGFKLYHTLHNNGCCGRFATLTPQKMVTKNDLCCYELYFVNTNFKTI